MKEPSKENKAKALAIVDFIMVTLEGKGAFYLILAPEAKETVITVSNIQNDDDIAELLQRAAKTEMR